MSHLGEYLKATRLRRNLSTYRLSHRLGLTYEEYRALEEHPESIPLVQLAKIFRALQLQGDEFIDFSLIALMEFGKPAIRRFSHSALPTPAPPAPPEPLNNVVEFVNRRGLRDTLILKQPEKGDIASE